MTAAPAGLGGGVAYSLRNVFDGTASQGREKIGLVSGRRYVGAIRHNMPHRHLRTVSAIFGALLPHVQNKQGPSCA